MSLEDPGQASFAGIGGLGDQVRELREVIELPLMNPELFEVGPAYLPLIRSQKRHIVRGHQKTWPLGLGGTVLSRDDPMQLACDRRW